MLWNEWTTEKLNWYVVDHTMTVMSSYPKAIEIQFATGNLGLSEKLYPQKARRGLSLT